MILECVYDYLSDAAPVLFLKLDTEGTVLSMNHYARQVCGELSPGMKFQDLILDFNSIFDLKNLSDTQSGEQMFNINTLSGYPQSYLFLFKTIGEEILSFGHLDMNDIGMMRTEFLSLNQELGNLSRQLHKKNAELQYALDHVKTLQGIIPICMHCHKIRNDKQVWDRLEAYLTRHTSAELSHSICPECAVKYYPDMDIYGKNET
jgi:hypothetical protein